MNISGCYYDLSDPEEIIGDAVVRRNGDEIAFDMEAEGYKYAVRLRRESGSHFTGHAVSRPEDERAALSCRVFEDKSSGLIVIVGHQWRYPDGTNSSWMVELQRE